MKKFLIITLTVLLLSACSLSSSPSNKVKSFLNGYINLNEDVKADLDTKVISENLSEEAQDIYNDVLTRQYQNIKYEIKDEKIDGDKATVKVKLTVYDLYKIDKDAVNYMNNNPNEFMENNIYSENKFNIYRLNQMLKTNETVSYEVDFYLDNKDGEWVIESPDRMVLEKIHGLYNYDSE